MGGLLSAPDDANIGFGLGLFALGGMGAPWSLPVLLNQQISLDSALFVRSSSGGALLNLILHAFVSRWWNARRGQPASG
ncbi:MAG: hypothetical protein LH624_00810 [Cryobacterium sp.]|nr:hypothetical protein [Cryobacterium sp.]